MWNRKEEERKGLEKGLEKGKRMRGGWLWIVGVGRVDLRELF